MRDFFRRIKTRLSPRADSRNRNRERRRLRNKAWDDVERVNFFWPKNEP